eukprot:m.24274 g.24274  ORF g.24274 m.24274 type:complete len:333 (+) comp6053_c0_seq1:329-1327(+)
MSIVAPTPRLWEAPTHKRTHGSSRGAAVDSGTNPAACGLGKATASAARGEAAANGAAVEPADPRSPEEHGQAGLAVYQLIEAETQFLHWEIFEEECYASDGWITLNDGDVVVDCGANIGLFTLWAAAQADLSTLVALEPMGPQFGCLERNVELHMLQKMVRTRQLAVGKSSAETSPFVFFPRMPSSSHREIYTQEKEGQRATMSAHRFDGATTTACATTTLSEIIAAEKLDRIDLLKVDVEGDELAVLEGLSKPDAARVRQIVMEAHAVDDRIERIRALLEGYGFEVRVGGGDARMERAGSYNIAAKRPTPEPHWVAEHRQEDGTDVNVQFL